jgi:hypothetical protein
VGGIAVGTVNWWVSAARASLAGRDGAWVVFGLTGFRTDRAAGWVFAQGSWVSIALAVAALSASSI